MIEKIFMPKNGGTMRKTYLWTVAAGLIYAGSSFLMSMVVSSLLGADQAGIFTIAMTIGNQLVTIGYYNMRTFQVSDVTEKYCFADYSGFRAVSIAVMILVGVIWIIAGGYSGKKMMAILFMLGFKVCEAISDLLEGRYQQKSRYDVSCRGVFVKTVLYLICFIVLLAVTGNLLIALFGMTISYLLVILVIDSRLIRHFGGFSVRFSGQMIASLLISCLPIFLNSFLMTYIVNASKYSMDRYYGETTLGYFNALYMMAFVVNLFSSFVLKPLITPLSVRFTDGDLKGFTSIIRRQVLIIFGITLTCLAGAAVCGTLLLGFMFHLDLSGYTPELCVILAGGAFTALYQLFQYGIVIMRHQIGCLAGCVITAGLTFLFTPVLIKNGDKFNTPIMAGAISYFCAMALMALVLLVVFVFFLHKERSMAESL